MWAKYTITAEILHIVNQKDLTQLSDNWLVMYQVLWPPMEDKIYNFMNKKLKGDGFQVFSSFKIQLSHESLEIWKKCHMRAVTPWE